MALLLARRHQKLPSNPSLIRLFSNFSSDPPPKPVNPSTEKPAQSPSSPSPFTDIKTTLIQKLQQQQDQSKPSFPRSDSQSQNRGSSRFSDNQSRGSIHDFGKNLANFQRRSTVPPSNDSSGVRPSQSRPQISLESLYKQNVAPNSTDPRNRKAPELNLNSVRESLWNLKNQTNASTNVDKSRNFQGALKSMAQGEDALPTSVFGKEIDGIKEGETEEMTTDFLTFYNEEELGEKLRLLRPEGNKEEGWFSLQELNLRLVKLRQVEEKEVQARSGNTVLRTVISNMRNDAAKNEKQNINFLSYLGDKYKLHPPKEELVETYFHPDNLSSAEKMKIELTKVRDEFKMSESDCGSARVQVAQLTTKIKHLSSLLHKKDKHSRKGLLGMVQKRKKLLKYLRRTDWDSYCLVLSKLSLRDNPDYKF